MNIIKNRIENPILKLKEDLYKSDYDDINSLKELCLKEDKTSLKLEIDYKLYCLLLNHNVAGDKLFNFDIIYNGREIKHMFNDEEIIELQKGQPFYFYDDVLE